MSTATATETTTDISLDLPCESILWYILLNHAAGPPCGKPATWLASVHSFVDCNWRPKALCDGCLVAILQRRCQTCKCVRIKDQTPIRGRL